LTSKFGREIAARHFSNLFWSKHKVQKSKKRRRGKTGRGSFGKARFSYLRRDDLLVNSRIKPWRQWTDSTTASTGKKGLREMCLYEMGVDKNS